jgi:ATP-dependent exoDNAse (exonuclease V) alpha subunit
LPASERLSPSGRERVHPRIYHVEEAAWTDAHGRRRVRLVCQPKSHELVACDGFICDEASMVSQQVYDDLLAYGYPVLFVGDHGQLEPVEDRFHLMANPDVTLETVHRHAGEIPRFAEFVRQGNAPVNWQRHARYTGAAVRFVDFADLHAVEVERAPDQIIVAFNKTRVLFNRDARELYGFPADHPAAGDRVICLQNDRELGIYNGQQGVIKQLLGDELLFAPYHGEEARVRYVPEQFGRPQSPRAATPTAASRLTTATASPAIKRRARNGISTASSSSAAGSRTTRAGATRRQPVRDRSCFGSSEGSREQRS